MELDVSEHALSVLITGFTEAQDAARRQREAILADVERATRSGRVPRHDHSRTDGADMSDSETLRAAAEVLRQRRKMYPTTRMVLDAIAGEVEAEDAAKLKAAERDQRLAQVADKAFHDYWGFEPDASEVDRSKQLGCMADVARAVREAIEAEAEQ
jgi:hypothetical protein